MTVQEMLERVAAAPDGPQRRADAELLAAHVLRRDRVWLRAHATDAFPEALEAPLLALAHRRRAGEPLQYLLEAQEFFGLSLRVSPAVLIPRPETEDLVQAVLDFVAARRLPSPRLVDVGTGSGAIALALAAQLPAAAVTAVDLSPAALAVARGNAAALGLERVRFVASDLLAAVADEPPFDVVVSNPPYIPEGDRAGMQTEVRDHEPAMALFAGEDGLAVYRRLIPAAARLLRPGGLLAMEFGFGQREALRGLLDGWGNVVFRDDLAGIPRVVLAERPA